MLKNIIKKLIAYIFRPEYKFAKRGDKCFIGSNCIINSASMIELAIMYLLVLMLFCIVFIKK